jgi:hypothetical protein
MQSIETIANNGAANDVVKVTAMGVARHPSPRLPQRERGAAAAAG